jgi:hypothetical protein
MNKPISRWKKFVLLNVCWVGGIVLAPILNPKFMHYPFWVCMTSIVAAYLVSIYFWFGKRKPANNVPPEEGGKTNDGVSNKVLIGFVLFLLAFEWFVNRLIH